MFLAILAKCHKHCKRGAPRSPGPHRVPRRPPEGNLVIAISPRREAWRTSNCTRHYHRRPHHLGILGAQNGGARPLEVSTRGASQQPPRRPTIVTRETDSRWIPAGFEKGRSARGTRGPAGVHAHKASSLPLPGQCRAPSSSQRYFFEPGGTTERMIFPDGKPKLFDASPLCWSSPAKEDKP